MSKRYWFKHNYYTRMDVELQELRSVFGAEGYGVFIMLIESMHESETGGIPAFQIGGLSFGFGVTKDRLKEIVEHCLSSKIFLSNDEIIYYQPAIDHLNQREYLSKMGKKGVENKKLIRESKDKIQATLKPPLSTPQATLKDTCKPPLSEESRIELLEIENTLSTENSKKLDLGKFSQKIEKNGKVNHNSGNGVFLGETEGESYPPLPF